MSETHDTGTIDPAVVNLALLVYLIDEFNIMSETDPACIGRVNNSRIQILRKKQQKLLLKHDTKITSDLPTNC